MEDVRLCYIDCFKPDNNDYFKVDIRCIEKHNGEYKPKKNNQILNNRVNIYDIMYDIITIILYNIKNKDKYYYLSKRINKVSIHLSVSYVCNMLRKVSDDALIALLNDLFRGDIICYRQDAFGNFRIVDIENLKNDDDNVIGRFLTMIEVSLAGLKLEIDRIKGKL